MYHAYAPAKLNLHLHVTGRRTDGYHLLESIIAFTDINDILFIRPAEEGLSLNITGPFATPLLAEDTSQNIVIKAATLLAAHAGIAPHASITLEKHIPLGGGLGGGSADAAVALHLLCTLWNLTPDTLILKQLALQLGADVPVFIERNAAFVSGIGEIIQPVFAFPPLHAVLVNPGIFLSTPAVFRQGVTQFSTPEKDIASICRLTDGALLAYLRCCQNDLEAPAIQLVPEIAVILADINAQPGCLLSRMSGSGATCFGIFTTFQTAAAAAATIQAKQPAWWVQITQIKSHFA